MSEVIEILKMGLPGLVFLLSAFSYKLLAKEQGKAAPSLQILKSIKHFMYIKVLLALLTLASPIIDHRFFSPESFVNVEAVKDSSILTPGTAAVCHNVEYASRFLLVKDNSTGKIVQVFSGTLIPCSGEQQIILNSEDTIDLGWDKENSKGLVEVVSALPGYKFSI